MFLILTAPEIVQRTLHKLDELCRAPFLVPRAHAQRATQRRMPPRYFINTALRSVTLPSQFSARVESEIAATVLPQLLGNSDPLLLLLSRMVVVDTRATRQESIN